MINESTRPKDLRYNYFSDRFGKNVEISIDDIEPIFTSTTLNLQDTIAAEKIIDRVRTVCLSKKFGTYDFCSTAKGDLEELDSVLRERSLKIRKSVHKRYSARGGGRITDSGAQYRGRILLILEDAIVDVSKMTDLLKQ